MTTDGSGEVASIVFAAGKGSRMTGYGGNKTLLPLIPKVSLFDGEHSLLIEVLENLPPGPKGIVVHHRAEDVKKATVGLDAQYFFQESMNGTGGALLAARPFLESITHNEVIITMGDVPLVRASTYRELVGELARRDLAVLGFIPKDKARYGMIEMDGPRVLRIVEWKYWNAFAPDRLSKLQYCNAGLYAAKRLTLLKYLDRLASQPHYVQKQRGDDWVSIEEYFLTDLVELMSADNLPVGVITASEEEVMGVDTPEILRKAQMQYAKRRGGKG